MKIFSIIIPAYNERNTIEKVFDAVEKSNTPGLTKEIVVVDDASTDGTRDFLKTFQNKEGYKIIFNEKNSGKGASLRRGLEESTGDFAIIQDADLEYDPNEYGKILQPLMEDAVDVVYGSRYLSSNVHNRKFSSHFVANRVLTKFSNLLSGLRLSDMETCYKCFTREALKKILPHLKSSRFEIEPEITAHVARERLRIMEVPISYSARTKVEGKKIGWKDGIPALWAIVKFNKVNFFNARKNEKSRGKT